jgi:hypothetical protein
MKAIFQSQFSGDAPLFPQLICGSFNRELGKVRVSNRKIGS